MSDNEEIRRTAHEQLAAVAGGQIVIDALAMGLTTVVAHDGLDRALRNMADAGEPPPTSVRVLATDGEVGLP